VATYKISGDLGSDARIIIMDETTGAINNSSVTVSGSYEVVVPDQEPKSVLARKDSGETIGYGNVIPWEVIYAPSYSETLCSYDNDAINIGNAGDTVWDHGGEWGKLDGSPFYTGGGIWMESPDEIPPYGNVEGVIRSHALVGDFDIRMTIGGIVFSIPDNEVYLSVGVIHPSNEGYVKWKLNSNYPTTSEINGLIRTGGTYYQSNNVYTQAQVFDFEFSATWRFRRIGGDGYVYFMDHELGDWRLLRSRANGFNTHPMLPFARVYRAAPNYPDVGAVLTHVDVVSVGSRKCNFYRLGNHTYRSVNVLNEPAGTPYNSTIDTSGNGLRIVNTGNLAFHAMVSDPAPFTGGDTSTDENQWEINAQYQTLNADDGRWGCWLEFGYMDTSGYDKIGTTSKYQDRVNKSFTETSAAVRLLANNYRSRVDRNVFDNSGNRIGGEVYISHPINYTGLFKIIHEGYNVYKFYLDGQLLYTWSPDDWETAGYINNNMYIAIGCETIYAHADHRWNYVELV